MTITAKVILASEREDGKRIYTLQLRYPRFFHAEFMTHRMFSRNASSSRAIPVEKVIADVMNDPAMPLHWGKNQAGMQAREEHSELVWSDHVSGRVDPKTAWLNARDWAVRAAQGFSQAGYHKQFVNRLLEPFAHIEVIVTATEWDNFFALRLHPDAQPEIQVLARAMRDAMENCSIQRLGAGEWHLPYASHEEGPRVSAARCARVSYLNHDGTKPDAPKDIVLANRLFESGHMSPFEHQAQVAGDPDTSFFNLRGFRSFRMDIEHAS